MTVRRTAIRGYAVAGAAYERSRPSYPRAALRVLADELAVGADRTVVDVGAGTGKLTRLLEDTGATVVAVEPVPAMLGHLVDRTRAAYAVGGAAERLPLRSEAADAVVAGTAFHWFDGDRALAEIDRVLRSGGGLGLVWNNPDTEVEWVGRVWGIVDGYRGEAPRNRDLRWRQAFDRSSAFTPLAHQVFAYEEDFALGDLLSRIASISFIAELEPSERDEALARVREVAETHPQLRGRARFSMPYRTDVYWCAKRPPGSRAGAGPQPASDAG